jgi:hypothetical protein
LKRLASWRTNIEVMWNILHGCEESLTVRNSEIPLMDITVLRKTDDSHRKRSDSRQKHIDIDDGLGCEIWHGYTPNRFDCDRHVAERLADPPAEELKACGPSRVVIPDNNRICHH